MHHAINDYQLRLEVQRFLWPVDYIAIYILYYAGPLTHCARITHARGKSLRGIFLARALVVAMPSGKECGSYPLGERRLK